MYRFKLGTMHIFMSINNTLKLFIMAIKQNIALLFTLHVNFEDEYYPQ